MSELEDATTLCILGCGNLGTAILTNLIEPTPSNADPLPFTNFIACVRSEKSEQALKHRFPSPPQNLTISRGSNTAAVQSASVIILAADPADIPSLLAAPGLRDALAGKLLISVAAGWTRPALETTLYGTATTAANRRAENRAWIIRTLPNIAALAAAGLTAIEVDDDAAAAAAANHATHLDLTTAIFSRVGRTLRVAPRHMDAATALAGSTPAFFAVICDALVDAGVAVGVPRDQASAMIFQAMAGTAAMLNDGVHPGVLKDRGTSPEGCTIGGLMVMEEGGVRGTVGRALREAVTVARLMGREGGAGHVNDTVR
ncbi:pyrroline-5-carboxylate reductase [Diplodia corticola]|uniref:Pyrroline-5-carboxylate reductase n=1 Tax=Diplodia corticola TaxID=236234 RepID=A0A1J9R903_9PEZI|nr:pyrroline-5-carboxylate reductase [Diplodia corticola]OJD38038.1 pyrroline-5-carboxylate reductase [Diplodia corticola]